MTNKPKSEFFTFILEMSGLDIKKGNKNVPYWSAFNRGFTANDIKHGKSPYHCVTENKTFYKGKDGRYIKE